MAEASDFLGLVEDIAVDLHVPHDAQFLEVFQHLISRDSRLEGH